MKRRDKIINIVGIVACILGFISSLVSKNYIACVLWVLLLLQDIREWNLEEIIAVQQALIRNQEKIIEDEEKLINVQHLAIQEYEKQLAIQEHERQNS